MSHGLMVRVVEGLNLSPFQKICWDFSNQKCLVSRHAEKNKKEFYPFLFNMIVCWTITAKTFYFLSKHLLTCLKTESLFRVKNSFNSLSEVACFLSKSFWCYNLFEQRHSLCLDRNMWVDSRILKRSKLLNAVVKTFHIHRSFQLIYWVIPIDSESM